MSRFVSLGLILTVMLGWFLFLRPVDLGGGTAYVIVSGDSMLPAYEPGDLVITRARETYAPGDVAVFTIPKGQPGGGSDARIIHRLTGGNGQDGYTAQGDNRDNPDPWTPTDRQVIGSEWLHLPDVGQWLQTLLSPPVVAALAGGLTTFIFIRRGQGTPSQELVEATCRAQR